MAQRQRGRRHAGERAGAQHVQHAVLHDFGVGTEVLERTGIEPGQHGVGGVAHARLDGQQVGRQPALGDFVREKLQDVAGDALRDLVRRRERGIAVRPVRLDDGDDLARVAAQRGLADAVGGGDDGDGLAVRRQARAVVDVVHALEAGALPGVHLEDDLVGLLDPGLVVAHRGRRDQLAVLADAGHLDHRDVEVAQEAEPDVLGDVGQVDVDIFHRPGVDALPAHRVGLVGQTHLDAVHLGQRAIELGRGRCAGPDADLERLASQMRRLDALRQRRRHRLRISRPGEAAHAHVVAGADQLHGLGGGNDAITQAGREHAATVGHGGSSWKSWQAGRAAAPCAPVAPDSELPHCRPRGPRRQTRMAVSTDNPSLPIR